MLKTNYKDGDILNASDLNAISDVLLAFHQNYDTSGYVNTFGRFENGQELSAQTFKNLSDDLQHYYKLNYDNKLDGYVDPVPALTSKSDTICAADLNKINDWINQKLEYHFVFKWSAYYLYDIGQGSSNAKTPYLGWSLSARNNFTKVTTDLSVYSGGGSSLNLPSGLRFQVIPVAGPLAVRDDYYIYATQENPPIINTQYGTHGACGAIISYNGVVFYENRGTTSVLFGVASTSTSVPDPEPETPTDPDPEPSTGGSEIPSDPGIYFYTYDRYEADTHIQFTDTRAFIGTYNPGTAGWIHNWDTYYGVNPINPSNSSNYYKMTSSDIDSMSVISVYDNDHAHYMLNGDPTDDLRVFAILTDTNGGLIDLYEYDDGNTTKNDEDQVVGVKEWSYSEIRSIINNNQRLIFLIIKYDEVANGRPMNMLPVEEWWEWIKSLKLFE